MKTNQNENNIQIDIDMFVNFLKDVESQMGRREELKEIISKIYSELLDSEVPVKYGVDEEPLKKNMPVDVKAHKNEIAIVFETMQEPIETIEVWMNREELSSFINNFMKACGKAFPE